MINIEDMDKAYIDWIFVRENCLQVYFLETPIITRGFYEE